MGSAGSRLRLDRLAASPGLAGIRSRQVVLVCLAAPVVPALRGQEGQEGQEGAGPDADAKAGEG